MDNVISLNSAQLKEAATLKEQIESLQERLNSVLGGASVSAPATSGKRTLSPEARAKIAAGQKKRWRQFHKEQAVAAATATSPVTPPVTPPVATAVAA